VTDFENKGAIVTGTTGIGKAVAKRLARGGAQVLACGIDAAANESLKSEARAEKLSLTRALALDYAADGIRVNSISPGSIATPMLELAARTFSPDSPVEEVFKRFGEAHPLGRVGTPEEVAELAAFLASPRARLCTGGDYLVDGGLIAGLK